MLGALLSRIGLEAAPAPDAAGLRAVHRAFLAHVPYENLAVQLGEFAPLDPDALVRRVVDERRGGYCFEVNTVLWWLLREVGFDVAMHEAVVGDAGPTNHMALVVRGRFEGAFLADAGLGEGFVDPLPFREGRFEGPGGLAWTLERRDDGTWWMGQHAWSSFSGFRMAPAPVTLAAFAPHHERLSTSPESVFVQTLAVQRPEDDRIVSLRARTLSEKGPAVDTRSVLPDADAFAAALSSVFGIDTRTLGAARLGRLWQAACEQHERHALRAGA